MTGRVVPQATEGAGRRGRVMVPCPLLVGRAAEVEILAAELAAATRGRGRVVFMAGEAGIGKSRLVYELAARAERQGVRIFRGRAVPGSAGSAFRPLAEALAPAVADVDVSGGELAPWLPALSGIVPALAPAAVELASPVRGEAVVRLLRLVCAPGAGLLVLEDLHWADPETVAVVEHLSDHLDRAPVLCIATVRPEEQGAAQDLVRRVGARRSAPVVELARLNDAQVAAMVHGCTGGTGGPAVERVVSLAEGVPFLVEEMLVSPGLPASFAETVRARLQGLPEDDRRVLVTAAACGRHFDWHLLGPATGLAEDRVVDALDRGVAAQLLAVDGEGFRFRHALTAEAVFASVIPPRRQAFAAAALAALDAGHAELPAGLREAAAVLAERAGQRNRAGGLHLAAGEDALRRGALHTAVAELEKAATLLAEGNLYDLASERLVDALVAAGRVDDALSAGAPLACRLPPPRAAAVHLRLAAGAATAARWELAGEQLMAASELIEAAGEPALRAELAVREAELALGTSDTARAERCARAALELARDHGLADVECAALQLLGRCARRSSLTAAEAWFRRGLDAAEARNLPVWRLRALHELGTIALFDRYEVDGLLAARELAEALGALATAAILDIELAAAYHGRDDFDAARRHGLRAVERGTELGMGLVAAYGWQHVAAVAMYAGDREQAESAAAAARAVAPGNRDIDGLLLTGQSVGALLANDLPRALALAERAGQLLHGSETVPPAHPRAALPVLLALARRPEAAAAVDELERAGLPVNPAGRAWLILARAILAGHSDAQRAAALAAQADDLLGHLPSAMWRSLARRLAAEAAVAADWPVPGNWLIEAEAWLRGHGFPAAAAACRALRGDPGAGMPAAWVRLGITPREADVLELVIEGRPNREIAERLYLSVRTVEKHVEALLRKTGARTRTQLARLAGTTYSPDLRSPADAWPSPLPAQWFPPPNRGGQHGISRHPGHTMGRRRP